MRLRGGRFLVFSEEAQGAEGSTAVLLFGPPLGWTEVLVALLILLVIRPVAGMIGLLGFRADLSEKLTLAFFGIRGVGSFYYLAYGLNHMEVVGAERLWAIVGLVVLLSVLMHGLTVTPIMRHLDRSHGRDPDADTPPPGLQGPGARE